MSVAYQAFYLSRWLVYFLHLVLRIFYGAAVFVSRPGSRWIVPILIGIAIYYDSAELDRFFYSLCGAMADGWNHVSVIERARRQAARLYYGYGTEQWILDCFLIALFLLSWVAYVLFSKLTAFMVATFPRVPKPLRPLRRLEATKQNFKSVPVTNAVPPLRR